MIKSLTSSRGVLLEGLNSDIMKRSVYCSLVGNVLSIESSGSENQILERYILSGGKGNLTASRIDDKLGRPVRKNIGQRGAIGWRPSGMHGVNAWGDVAPQQIRLSFYDEASGAVAYLPLFTNDLQQYVGGRLSTAFYPGVLHRGTRVFAVGDRAIVFTSGEAEQGKIEQRRTLSGYSLYFMSVDFIARTYVFELHSEIGNTAIPAGAEQEIGAHISHPDEDNRFFIVTSEGILGSNLFKYTISRYEIAEAGISFEGSHEFTGDFGHVLNDALAWQGEGMSLFRTYLGGNREESRSMFHAFDWENGTLLDSIDSAKIGAPKSGSLQAIEIDGNRKAVFYTDRYAVNPDGMVNEEWTEMTSVWYDRKSRSFAAKLEMKRLKVCLSGNIQYYLTERDGAVFLEDLTPNKYGVDETEYKLIEDFDYLRSSTTPTCFDGKVGSHKTGNVSDRKETPRGLLSFPRVCGIEKYRVQNSWGEANAADVCDIFGWCHLVTSRGSVNVESLEGLIDGVWKRLR